MKPSLTLLSLLAAAALMGGCEPQTATVAPPVPETRFEKIYEGNVAGDTLSTAFIYRDKQTDRQYFMLNNCGHISMVLMPDESSR